MVLWAVHEIIHIVTDLDVPTKVTLVHSQCKKSEIKGQFQYSGDLWSGKKQLMYPYKWEYL